VSAGDPPPPRFRVGTSADVIAVLRECQDFANHGGFGPAFLAAVKYIHQQLRTSADTFGEPLFDLPDARLQVRKAVIRPAVVEYGIHYKDPVVFIRSFRLLPPTAV
jgi:hypothetical protein